jgi:FAD/FMN-containing dehydrogenase
MLNNEIIKKFAEIVGSDHVRTSPNDLEKYGRDWLKHYPSRPSVIVFPGCTAEVSAVMKFCSQQKLKVVPSGGRTGLCGGASAQDGEVVISLERMRKIIQVDPVGMLIRLEAGVTTQAAQEAAESVGLFFALDLSAKGSSQIGGNLATNAGGLKLIRYGGAREQVIGLEVVLANGDVLDLNTALRKNNVGYDLKQLFIGSEGTLGIITQATLRLLPPPGELSVMLVATHHFSSIPEILRRINLAGMPITAFEFFDRPSLDLVLKTQHQLRSPFSEMPAYTALVEFEKTAPEFEQKLETLLESWISEGLAVDAVLATTSKEFSEFWALRELISESTTTVGLVRKNDISVPIAELSTFVEDLAKTIQGQQSEISTILFGHIGDGNLHINYLAPAAFGKERFTKEARELELKIFGLLPRYRGSISAEHGIGLSKKQDLHLSLPDHALPLMKALKRTLDPDHILNPGKIFDA